MNAAVDNAESSTCPNANATVLSSLVPYLQVSNASKAAEFYQRAFGAVEVARQPVDEQGRTMHIHLHINNSSLMLCDAYPEYGQPLQKPQAFDLTLMVHDIDQWFERAIAAGAEVVMPVQKMFWGDRYGQLRDPFGVSWSMNERAA